MVNDTKNCQICVCLCLYLCACLCVLHTYHSPLPNYTHPVLNASHPVRDLCEILLAQSSLLGTKWTVLWCHNTQSVTGNNNIFYIYSILGRGTSPIHLWLSWTHTCPAGPWGSRACWGQYGGGVQWHGRQHEPSPGDSTVIHSALHEPLWSLHGPPYLQREQTKEAG